MSRNVGATLRTIMNDNLLLGAVFAVVVAALYLLYRGRRRVPQRCPACHRFGHGEHYGRYRCVSCGAHFVLDATGRPSPTVWGVVYAPVSVLLLIVACLVIACVTSAGDLPVGPVGIILVFAWVGWELHRTFREKPFRQDDHLA
jgi:hypothetical protein